MRPEAPRVPDELARTIREVFGERGAAWLEGLPELAAECQRRWALTLQPPYPGLSYNFVAPALRADGQPVVLKLGVPNPELASEIEALRVYDGRGSVRLLEADAQRGAVLLERLRPGTQLVELADDAAATTIAAGVMRQLWRPLPEDHPFPSVGQWAAGLQRLRQRFGGGSGPLPEPLVAQAESLFARLLASAGPPVLLHGDLHHFNILAAERQPWLAIDPKGLAGEREYETGAWLRNPSLQPASVLARRVDQLAAELSLDRERLLGWGVAQAVLSAWWSLEDHGYGWEEAIACAERLAGLR